MNLTEHKDCLDKKTIYAAEPETRPSLRSDQRIVRYRVWTGEKWWWLWCSEAEFRRYTKDSSTVTHGH